MKHTEAGATGVPTNVAPLAGPEWVLAEKYEQLTGVSREAIRSRRKKGVWLDGKHTKVVMHKIYVNIKAVDQWISDQGSNCQQA